MLEKWFSDPTAVGATVLLMTAVVAFARGLVVPRWSYDVMQIQLTRELERSREDCELYKNMNLRLLGQIEMAATAAEMTAEVATKVANRPTRRP